ncbi:hypothetical protein RAD10_37270 [Bradyrhizobium sp. 23AC]
MHDVDDACTATSHRDYAVGCPLRSGSGHRHGGRSANVGADLNGAANGCQLAAVLNREAGHSRRTKAKVARRANSSRADAEDDVWGIVRSDLYAIGNLHYEFLEGTRIDVAGTGFASGHDRLWGSIGGGGTYSWANGRYAVFGEVTYRASLDAPADNHSYRGTGGFRLVW